MGGIMVLLLLIIILHVNLGHGDANMTMRCTDKEREALLAFKEGLIMDENSQAVFSSWGAEAAKQDCCRWKGVSCDNQTGHVVQLDLHDNYLLKGNNKFVGELPSSFKNCTSLQLIDVGNNKLSGRIPKWLGASLHNLIILMLFSNNFNGSLPSELCGLTNIQNLDVSANNISGTIPKCLSNLTALAHKGNSSPTLQHFVIALSYYDGGTYIYGGGTYMDDATFIWKGSMRSYRNILGLVKRIDFSSNRLTGEIPSEITDLVGLVSLNLSRNRLTGEIPTKIGELQSLDALDLSRNQIDGKIPKSLARIDRLSFLDLSHNNFIGRIPTGTQLQSFDPSVYAGNPQLCGPPLQKMCGNQQETLIPIIEEEKDDLITWGFYVSMGLGFIVGFWGVCGSLIFVRPWRYSYFRFLNVLNDWFYVRVISIKRHFN